MKQLVMLLRVFGIREWLTSFEGIQLTAKQKIIDIMKDVQNFNCLTNILF